MSNYPKTGSPLSPSQWREINSMTISFGHGLAVSPLHLVAGVSAIVNGGIYRTPHADPPRSRRDGCRQARNLEQTSLNMRRLMRLVVESGTGRKASAHSYLVGGKTGTAEKVSGRGYKE